MPKTVQMKHVNNEMYKEKRKPNKIINYINNQSSTEILFCVSKEQKSPKFLIKLLM